MELEFCFIRRPIGCQLAQGLEPDDVLGPLGMDDLAARASPDTLATVASRMGARDGYGGLLNTWESSPVDTCCAASSGRWSRMRSLPSAGRLPIHADLPTWRTSPAREQTNSTSTRRRQAKNEPRIVDGYRARHEQRLLSVTTASNNDIPCFIQLYPACPMSFPARCSPLLACGRLSVSFPSAPHLVRFGPLLAADRHRDIEFERVAGLDATIISDFDSGCLMTLGDVNLGLKSYLDDDLA